MTKDTNATQAEVCDALQAFVAAHRDGIKTVQATSCKPLLTEDGSDFQTDAEGKLVYESEETPDFDTDGNPVMVEIPIDNWELEMKRTLACREVGGQVRTSQVASLQAKLAEMEAKLKALGVTA